MYTITTPLNNRSLSIQVICIPELSEYSILTLTYSHKQKNWKLIMPLLTNQHAVIILLTAYRRNYSLNKVKRIATGVVPNQKSSKFNPTQSFHPKNIIKGG